MLFTVTRGFGGRFKRTGARDVAAGGPLDTHRAPQQRNEVASVGVRSRRFGARLRVRALRGMCFSPCPGGQLQNPHVQNIRMRPLSRVDTTQIVFAQSIHFMVQYHLAGQSWDDSCA